MTGEGDEGDRVTFLQESAFPTSLSLFDIATRFWSELKKVLPAAELHVIDPYILDAGGTDPATFAGNVVSLLKPALTDVDQLVVVHAKAREGIQVLLTRDIGLVASDLSVRFEHGTEMHARYLVADRSRVLRMEFSFNRIGKSFGTISLVEDDADRKGILGELQRLDPAPEG